MQGTSDGLKKSTWLSVVTHHGTYWASFSFQGSAVGTSPGFRGQHFVPSVDIGSVWSGYSSRLLGASTFLNSDSKSTQTSGLHAIW